MINQFISLAAFFFFFSISGVYVLYAVSCVSQGKVNNAKGRKAWLNEWKLTYIFVAINISLQFTKGKLSRVDPYWWPSALYMHIHQPTLAL